MGSVTVNGASTSQVIITGRTHMAYTLRIVALSNHLLSAVSGKSSLCLVTIIIMLLTCSCSKFRLARKISHVNLSHYIVMLAFLPLTALPPPPPTTISAIFYTVPSSIPPHKIRVCWTPPFPLPTYGYRIYYQAGGEQSKKVQNVPSPSAKEWIIDSAIIREGVDYIICIVTVSDTDYESVAAGPVLVARCK